MKTILSLVSVFFLIGCGTLNPTGPYKGDKLLYDADQVIVTGYDLLHVFVSWEFNNRVMLSDNPEIKDVADNVRTNAKKWFSSAKELRAAYIASATEPNKTALTQAIAVIRAAVVQATAYLTTYGPAKAK